MLGKTPSYLPKKDSLAYRTLALFLYILFGGGLIYGALTFLFPYERYSFDFNNPNATKNNLFEPHLEDFSFVEKGKVTQGNSIFIYANNPQVLEAGDVRIAPSEDHPAPHLEGAAVTVRRGWAATFFPIGDEQDFPNQKIVEYQGNFYEQRENTLYPFVSEAAALSFAPKERISSLPPDAFNRLAVNDELLGFRPGTLLAYADGVFVVTEEGTIRPFGSAEVLLRSGYTFDHVIPASGEDTGIYKRGRIILPGQLHLGGTLFYDTDTQKTYLLQGKKLLPLTSQYAQFLSSQNDQVRFSSLALRSQTTCTLTKELLRDRYGCRFDIAPLQDLSGNDYQVSLSKISNETDIQEFFVGLQSSREKENAAATARSLFIRVLERIGLYQG